MKTLKLFFVMMLPLLVFGILFFVAVQYAFSQSVQESKDFDYGKFRFIKDSVYETLEKTAMKYAGEEYNLGKMNGFVADASSRLVQLTKDNPTFKYKVFGNVDKDKEIAELFLKKVMVITTVVYYGDEKSMIEWEFQTVLGKNTIDIYSVVTNGEEKKFEDYHHWKHLRKNT